MTFAIGSSDTALTSTAVPIVTVPQGASYIILAATAVNTDTAAHQVSVWRVQSGGATSNPGALVVDQQSIAPGETAQLPIVGQTMVNADSFLAAVDTAGVVNLNLSWVQVL